MLLSAFLIKLHAPLKVALIFINAIFFHSQYLIPTQHFVFLQILFQLQSKIYFFKLTISIIKFNRKKNFFFFFYF